MAKKTALIKGFLKSFGLELFRAMRDVGVFLAAAYVLLRTNEYFRTPLSELDLALLQNFIEWYAVFYTVALSIIVGQAWTKYNRVNSEIDREADALTLMVQTSRMGTDHGLSARLVHVVTQYVNNVREVLAMDERDESPSEEKMKQIRDGIEQLVLSEQTPESIKSELLKHYNDAFDARGDRFDLLGRKLQFYMWFVFIAFSMLWLWSFFCLEIESAALRNYILGCTVFSACFLYYLARDLDDPKRGFWRMNFNSFEQRIF